MFVEDQWLPVPEVQDEKFPEPDPSTILAIVPPEAVLSADTKVTPLILRSLMVPHSEEIGLTLALKGLMFCNKRLSSISLGDSEADDSSSNVESETKRAIS